MPRHPNDAPITQETLSYDDATIDGMTFVEYRDLIAPLMNIVNLGPWAKPWGPLTLMNRWLKKYSRRRIYQVMVVIYRGPKRFRKTQDFAAYATRMLIDKYAESKEYEVLDGSDEARYGR